MPLFFFLNNYYFANWMKQKSTTEKKKKENNNNKKRKQKTLTKNNQVKNTNPEKSVTTLSTQPVKTSKRGRDFFLFHSHEITNQSLTMTDESGSNLSNAVKTQL